MESSPPERLEEPARIARTRILLVDDHALVAETVAAFVGAQGDFAMDIRATVDQALGAIRENGRYDAVLLDYNLPGMNGMAGLVQVIEANGGRVALFSGVASRVVIERALELGASGFIPKTLAVKSLINALRFIASGEIYLPGEFITRSLNQPEGAVHLKPVEQKVLMHLCEGLQNKEIANILNLTEVSVKMHVKAICGKFGVKNRTQAVVVAKRDSLC